MVQFEQYCGRQAAFLAHVIAMVEGQVKRGVVVRNTYASSTVHYQSSPFSHRTVSFPNGPKQLKCKYLFGKEQKQINHQIFRIIRLGRDLLLEGRL